MDPHFNRGQLLLSQSRFDLAEQEFRLALAHDPDDPLPHALLALCILEREGFDEAQAEAERAVGLGPDLPFCRRVLAAVFLRRNRLEEAEKVAQTGLEMDPYDPEMHLTLANINLLKRDWKRAEYFANEGLALEPDHVGCANARATALTNLGRKDEAEATIRGILERDPEDAFSHANQGWTALHQSDPNKALEHFREALRLEPDLEWAQAGMVEALKARYFLYRWMLRFFLWMGSLGNRWQWAIILGLLFFNRSLGTIANQFPWAAPYLLPLQFLLFGFTALTWLAEPLFNVTLRWNRYGKHMLKPLQRIAADVTLVLLLAALGVAIYAIAVNSEFGLLSLILVTYTVVVNTVFRAPPGQYRWGLALAALVLLGVGGYAMWAMLSSASLPNPLGRMRFREGNEMLQYYVYGVLGITLFGNVAATARPVR
jgi:tetratricopeptide (TPR) repeat protein